jgi:hypothetical protein
VKDHTQVRQYDNTNPDLPHGGKTMRTAVAAVLFILSLPCIVLGDDSVTLVRCKSGLVNVGASKMEVIGKCGDPLHKDIVEKTSKRANQDYVKVDEWSYNFGPGDFLYTFLFEGSSLVDIRRGDRGF